MTNLNPYLFVIFQLVESAAACLVKIADGVGHSADMLDELCKHGLVQQAAHLINLNSRTSLCHQIYLVRSSL